MIRVVYQKLDDGRHELTVTGHAGGPKSEAGDLVCCAASMVLYTLAARLEEQQLHGYCAELGTRLESGSAMISAMPGTRCSCRTDEAFRMACAGYRALEGQYPECVCCDFHTD